MEHELIEKIEINESEGIIRIDFKEKQNKQEQETIRAYIQALANVLIEAGHYGILKVQPNKP